MNERTNTVDRQTESIMPLPIVSGDADIKCFGISGVGFIHTGCPFCHPTHNDNALKVTNPFLMSTSGLLKKGTSLPLCRLLERE